MQVNPQGLARAASVRGAAPETTQDAQASTRALTRDTRPGAASPVPTDGVPDHWLRRLPSPLRYGAVAATSVLGSLWDKATGVFRGDPVPEPVPASPKDRAAMLWRGIEERYGVPGLPGVFRETPSATHLATVWPHGQAIAAALDMAELTGDWTPVDQTMRALAPYTHDEAYAPGMFTVGAKRLWDDNAWIGLDFLQAYAQTGNKEYLAKAEGLFPFMKEGLHKDGGIYWEERNHEPSRNTCANAPAMAMALKLHAATGKAEYKAFAENLHKVLLDKLRSPEGLYYDLIKDDGRVDKTFYTYNQGAAIGAEIELWKQTGDPRALARAKETANAALAYFSKDDRLWKQPPAFNAIFFRNLLVLDAHAPDPRYRQATEAYVERVWKEGRDPVSGRLDQGGIGSYTPSGILDEAGIAQLNALLGWPKERLKIVA